MATLTSAATAATSVEGGEAWLRRWSEDDLGVLRLAGTDVPRRRPQGEELLFPTESRLFYGDNLTILRNRKYVADGSVDLVYLDPPFKPTESYNLLFRTKSGNVPAAAQVRAFGHVALGRSGCRRSP